MGAFGEKRARGTEGCDDDPDRPHGRVGASGLRVSRSYPRDQRGPGCQRDEEGEREIRQCLPGQRHIAEAGRRDEARQEGGWTVEVPPSCSEREQR